MSTFVEVQCRRDTCKGAVDCCWKSISSCQGHTLEQVSIELAFYGAVADLMLLVVALVDESAIERFYITCL